MYFREKNDACFCNSWIAHTLVTYKSLPPSESCFDREIFPRRIATKPTGRQVFYQTAVD